MSETWKSQSRVLSNGSSNGVVENKNADELEEEKLFNTSKSVEILIESMLKTKETQSET